MIPQVYNQNPLKEVKTVNRSIAVFNTGTDNIDQEVVGSFGAEWSKFHNFHEEELARIGDEYFDILDHHIINKNTYGIDIGCGSGRWTKCLLNRIGFMEAIDPSEAIFAADELLNGATNVRLSVASTDNIPFADETFDFAMTIGVLHHIPDTSKAMIDCLKKVKRGGYFYTYLYYNLDNKGNFSKALLSAVTVIRKLVCRLPSGAKKTVCDLLAVFVYMPNILLSRFLWFIGLRRQAGQIPLSSYRNKSFYIIRNDSLDRFGTKLEQRFSQKEIIEMMTNAGLGDIVISKNQPYWHTVGRKK